MTRIRLEDVAADAGVSKATVSMVLNDSPLVAEHTRLRVLESLTRTGYVYNTAAASLRKKRTNVVGLVVTTLMNPYLAEFAESIQAELDALGMDVLLGVSGDDPTRQTRLLNNMAGRRVDGLVMVAAQGTAADTLTPLDMPMLLLARRVEGAVADYVGGDNERGAEVVTEHLITVHSSQRIAFFGGGKESSAGIERRSGYHRALARHDLEPVTSWDKTCPADRRVARAISQELLREERPDAVVCYNDIIALGLADAATELGMKVGHDIRITGFDDIEEAAFAATPLTSVAVPARTAGQAAASMLRARIEGRRDHTEELILPTDLHPRASCGCP